MADNTDSNAIQNAANCNIHIILLHLIHVTIGRDEKMASPQRLDNNLVNAAKIEAQTQKRSTPKQIEYWADLGRSLENLLSKTDITALEQGLVELEIKPITLKPIDPEDILSQIEQEHKQGKILESVSEAPYRYIADPEQSGFLIKIEKNGKRVTGKFKNGIFQPIKLAENA